MWPVFPPKFPNLAAGSGRATIRGTRRTMRAGKQSASTRNERAGCLAARVAATLPGGGATALAETLRTAVSDAARYEASVRRGAAGVRAGRMMIEQSPGELVAAIAAALAVELPAAAARWIESAAVEEVPLIAGWDLRGGGG